MTTAPLHLVDSGGFPVAEEIKIALQTSYRWAVWRYPLVDSALIASWAEEIGVAMSSKEIVSPRRYATAALHGRIREYFRSGGLRETTMGVSQDLERWAEAGPDPKGSIERSILFDQMRTQLSERDRQILVLLRQDISSARDVGIALDLSYEAAAKAVQRVKNRMRDILTSSEKNRKEDSR